MSQYEQIGRSIVKAGTLAAIVTFDKDATDQEIREFNRLIRSSQALLAAIEQISGQLHNIENVSDMALPPITVLTRIDEN